MSASGATPERDGDRRGEGTRAVHGGERPDPATGALSTPVYRTTTFRFDTTDDLIAGARGERPGFYTRYGNPNFEVVERKFADLHGGPAVGAEDAVCFASGLAALAGVLQGCLKAGDRVVATRDLYGGSRALLGEVERFGIRTTVVPTGDERATREALRGARMLVTESPTNPTLRVLDLPRLCEAAHREGAIVVFDNTFATPVNLKPLAHGVDVAFESATKSLGGHSDVLGGIVVARAPVAERVRKARKLFGAIMDPDAAWLLARGMRTLVARVERQNRSGLEVATWLERHPAVARVSYPGLPSHPDHAVAKRLMTGFGGIVTFACRGGPEAARRVADRVRLIANAPSLGGAESLLSLPLHTSHAMSTPEERAAAGIGDDLVRLSVGLEDVADVTADLDQALR
jgi:cystathionine beta-lyase/cystathionine gamma-synthase